MFRAVIIFLLIGSCVPRVFGQAFDFGLSAYHTTALYKNWRHPQLYEQNRIGNPEVYFSTGIYLKPYEGSLLDFLFEEKRFMIGDAERHWLAEHRGVFHRAAQRFVYDAL